MGKVMSEAKLFGSRKIIQVLILLDRLKEIREDITNWGQSFLGESFFKKKIKSKIFWML